MADYDGRAGSGIGAEPSQARDAAPHGVAGGYGVAIRRVGQAVEITLTAGSEYASIELYDNLVQSVRNGRLRLELNIPRS